MNLTIISHPYCALHEMTPGHPECPERLLVIDRYIRDCGLFANAKRVTAEAATIEQIALAHDRDYIDSIQDTTPFTGLRRIDADTAMNPYTFDAALFAAGSGIQAVDLVMSESQQLVYCNIRPPGHHAEHNKAMGFCFFNNIAIAAKYALKKYHCKKIAIIDFDVHHGNGTEDIVKENRHIDYFSSFQYPFYPYSFNLNGAANIHCIPLAANTNSEQFQALFTEQCLLLLEKLQPDLLLISAGFDAHANDPLADILLTEKDYFWLGKQLQQIAKKYADGRIVAMLEGGYALDILGQSVVAHLAGLCDFGVYE